MIKVRMAAVSDAQSVLDIYRPYVLDSGISFEVDVPSLVSIQSRITETLKEFPWLILERDSKVLGYAYAGHFKLRAAYEWTVEAAIYISPEHCQGGLGTILYKKLIQVLEAQGIVNVIGIIAVPNDASIYLHQKLGFKKVGFLSNVGFKLGNWWSVEYWQLSLKRPLKPTRLQPYTSLGRDYDF